MEEKRYLKWYNKVGYGSGDVAGNVVYAFLSTFVMLYLTNTVGLNPGIVGTLIAVFIVFWKDILRLFVDGVGIVADSCVNVYRFFRSKNKKEPVEYIRVI